MYSVYHSTYARKYSVSFYHTHIFYLSLSLRFLNRLSLKCVYSPQLILILTLSLSLSNSLSLPLSLSLSLSLLLISPSSFSAILVSFMHLALFNAPVICLVYPQSARTILVILYTSLLPNLVLSLSLSVSLSLSLLSLSL